MQRPHQDIEEIPADPGLPSLEDYAAAEEDALLKHEWRVIGRRAHLTSDQWDCFKWYHVYGCSLRMTAGFVNLDESTVRYHLKAAYSRIRRVPNQGLLTVLIETFGLSDVMEAMEGKRNGKTT